MKTLLLSLLFCSTAFAQNTFPDQWIGEYEGTMAIGYTSRPSTTVDVEFTIAEVESDSIWTHKMIFYSEQYGVITKDYLIRAMAKEDKINFLLDEQNGIEMEMSLMDDCFYGLYTVMGNTYITTLRKLDDVLLWDLFMAPASSLKTTKLEGEGDEDDMEVESMKPNLHQTVLLKRKG